MVIENFETAEKLVNIFGMYFLGSLTYTHIKSHLAEQFHCQYVKINGRTLFPIELMRKKERENTYNVGTSRYIGTRVERLKKAGVGKGKCTGCDVDA